MATFVRRILGALALERGTFENVEADRGALGQAMLVVILASAAAGLGRLGVGDGGLRAVAAPVIGSLAAWAAWAGLIAFLGTRILPSPSTSSNAGELMRTMGFAAAPGLLRAFEVLGDARWFMLPLTSVWMIAAMTVAVRQALDYESLGRAVSVVILGWLVAAAVATAIGLLFAVPVS
jgi:hypothetical protein